MNNEPEHIGGNGKHDSIRFNVCRLDIAVFNLPGVFVLVNHPNFDINNPSTWTGEVAQYVVHRYTYTVQFHITNSGKGTGYDSELDVGYFYDDGSDVFDTYYIGNITSYGERMKTVEIVCENKQLEESGAEVYWYNY